MLPRRAAPYFLCLQILFVAATPLLAHPPRSENPEPVRPTPVLAYEDREGGGNVISEGFEGAFPPAGWAVIHLGATYTWEQTASEANSGAYSTWVRYGPQGVPQDEWLVTPALDLSGVTSAYLEFFEDQSYWPGFGEHHYVAVSTTSQTDPGAFTTIVDWTPANHVIGGFGGDPVVVSLAAYVGEPVVYVALRYVGTWADDWFVDDLRVFEPFAFDASVQALSPDGVHVNAPQSIEPTATVENRGSEQAAFDVRLEIERSGAIVYTELASVDLAPGEASELAFPALAAEPGHYYHLDATALLVGDQDPANDGATAHVDTYTRPRTPLGHLHTNAGCGPCGVAEPFLDAFMATQGDSVSLIRLHTWWPGSDPIYAVNSEQADSIIYSYAADYTPHFWVDGIFDAEFLVEDWIDSLQAHKAWLSPAEMRLHWLSAEERLIVQVDVLEPLDPDGDYRLRTAFTQDSLLFIGGNGHNWHDQAFRYMYPDVNGLPVPSAPGTYSYAIDCPLDPLDTGIVLPWVPALIRATAYLQDESTWRVWQSVSAHLPTLEGAISLDASVTEVEEESQTSVAVRIAPPALPVKGVEVEIDFDPAVVRLDSIVPGPWYADSGQEYIFYDYVPDLPEEATSVHFASAFLVGSSAATGEIARAYFTGLVEGGTPLDFSLVKVRDVANNELDYASSAGDSIVVLPRTTSVPVDQPAAPAALRLLPNQPNPFNPSTRLRFELPSEGTWRLEIYDVSGRRIRTLLDGRAAAGSHELVWDGRNDAGRSLGSGLYLARLSGAEGSRGRKLVLLK